MSRSNVRSRIAVWSLCVGLTGFAAGFLIADGAPKCAEYGQGRICVETHDDGHTEAIYYGPGR